MANFEFNSFVGGLITDANPLTFPENTSKDENNFKLNIDGSRQRRLGLNYDDAPDTLIPPSGYKRGYLWENVNSTGVSLYVVQVGLVIYFHKVDEEGIRGIINEINYEGMLAASYPDPSIFRLSFTSGLGRLFVAGEHIDPFWIEFKPDTETLFFGSDNQIDIKIRDFEGVRDGLDVDERPSSLSLLHRYNLVNQGWGKEVTYNKVIEVEEEFKQYPISIGGQEIGFPPSIFTRQGTSYEIKTRVVKKVVPETGFIYEQYKTSRGVYPSNSQIWTIGKDSNDNFDPALLDKMDFGSSFAPRGKHIIDPFFQEREVKLTPGATAATPVHSPIQENSRPDSIAFFQGRVFYGGIRANNTETRLTTGHVFFSQIITDISRAGKCYQEADPTSEHISDIIADDGGVIVLSGCGKILSMVPMSGSLLVIADNGVWEITGNDAGFSALGYRVRKLSDFGAVSQEFVTYEGAVFYLSDIDWMMIAFSNENGGYNVTSLTENSVSRFYRNIPYSCRESARLIFDDSTKTAIMMYSMDAADCENRNNLLMFDFNLRAWYRYTYSVGENRKLIDLAYVPDSLSFISDENVLVENELVVSEGEVVFIRTLLSPVSTPQLRFMVVDNNNSYRFAYMFDDSFKDFTDNNYDSYLVTGVNTFQDTMRNKQIEYIVTSLKRTEELFQGDAIKQSSCLLSTRWDFSDDSISGKWSRPQQAYRYKRFFIPEGQDMNYGHDVIQTKNKVRGTGKALSFVFESEEGKDLHLYGWAVSMSGRRGV